MTIEQEKELLDYLASLGFTGEQFSAELQEKLKLNTPGFTVRDKISFGEDQMFFNLRFIKDPQFSAYRLEKYDAIYREPVTIEHSIINGINTSGLEEQMKAIDWNGYFKDHVKIDEQQSRKINVIMDDLLKLTGNDSASGWDMQRKLQYKYWPEQAHDPSAKSLEKELEHSRTFASTESGICNTTLAYQILSGKMDDLYEKLQQINTDEFFKSDLYIKLDSILSKNTDPFILKFGKNTSDGFAELEVPVIKTDGNYAVNSYTATLTPYPPIEHGVYNGIDTRQLESQMRSIDWHEDGQLFIYHEDSEPEFTPKAADIQEQIYRLSQGMIGADIADQLQLKYWQDTTFFSDMIQQTAWDHLDELPGRMREFPVEADANIAFNLLAGRAVMEQFVYPFDSQPDNWIRLDVTARNAHGNCPEMQVSGFDKEAVGNLLDAFPIAQSDYYWAKNLLMRGGLVPLELQNDKNVLMEANPEQRTVNVYTPDMRLIPVNIHLDPDWKPAQADALLTNQQNEKRKQIQSKFQTGKAVKKHKGKGL